jgi:type I restriction enzyme M protein
MNLFLHGIEDFHIVNDDTLASPALLKEVRCNSLMWLSQIRLTPSVSGTVLRLRKISMAEILGVPPQGRADYAFLQHILKSLNQDSGRCAILFPHGVLFRNEEKEMREKLVRSDLLECVIGMGPNLFYNSPMEACIIICRTKKPDSHKEHVLFINAVNEVTRKNAEAFWNLLILRRLRRLCRIQDG